MNRSPFKEIYVTYHMSQQQQLHNSWHPKPNNEINVKAVPPTSRSWPGCHSRLTRSAGQAAAWLLAQTGRWGLWLAPSSLHCTRSDHSHTHILSHLLASIVNYCLVGLVVKASASREEDPVFESRLWWDFSALSHTSDLKIGTPVATLSGARCYRVSHRTGRSGVSILWLCEAETLICSFYLSVAARKLSEQIRPWDTLVCWWNVKQPTTNHC